jgi:hypothetical protein
MKVMQNTLFEGSQIQQKDPVCGINGEYWFLLRGKEERQMSKEAKTE